MNLTSEMIKKKAAELGIDDIGIGNIGRFDGAPPPNVNKKLLSWCKVGNFGFNAYTSRLLQRN